MKSNAEKCRLRRRRLKALASNITPAQWRLKVAQHGGRCAICKRKTRRIERDHIIPISRGGTDTIGNVQPACPRCNGKKGVRM